MKTENVDDFGAGKRISIEPGTQLQMEIEGVEYRFKSTLVGMEPDKYLIIKTPMAPPSISIQVKLFRGSQIVVRYLDRGTVFGFQTKLIEAISTPVRLLFIECPRVIEHYDLRSHERIDCFLPAKIRSRDKDKQGTILDISEKGCRFLIKALKGEKLPSLRTDEQISLRCQFPGIEGEYVVSGKVKNIRRDEQEMALGIEFQETDPQVQNIIAQYISTIRELI